MVIHITTPKGSSVISLQIHTPTTENPGSTPVAGDMTDGRRWDGSYGPEYGPLPPEHEYGRYHHLPSRGRVPWPLPHGDFAGRLLEHRLRSGSFGFPRHSLQPYAPFEILHVNGGGATINRTPSREDPGLTDEEFRKAMQKLRKQAYMPSNPQKKRGGGGILWNKSARAEAPTAAATEEEKACTICLETFLPREQVVITPCDHMFHQGCIAPWVKGHGTCPVCRFALCERRHAGAGEDDGGSVDLDLDLLAMMSAMEEAFGRVRLSDFYH